MANPDKVRANLYLDRDVYERAQDLVERLPGLSVSEMVSDLLKSAIEPLEQLLEMAESGNKDAQAEMMSRLLADQLLGLAGEGIETLRIVKDSEPGKEKAP